ncbi:MAG: endolytic transglycosylase MltG [Ruminiclostridium sp.]|nr:endolytic transglycosylase MltG [Ruminiclostridium sp.]
MTYILMVFGISAILAVVGWTIANDLLALNKEEATASIYVAEDADFGDVVDQLKDKGIINYKSVFSIFTTLSGGQDKISPGTYNLNTDMDYRAIINNLGSSSAARASALVTIPEGYTMDQIFALLEEKGVSSVAKLQDMAANHDYAFSFLQDIPLGDYHRLEGYLFPDTYEFYMGEDPKYIINKMLVNFDAKVTDAMRQQIWDKGYSIGQVLTVASMIEKESDGTERATISSVIYNRLNNPSGGTQGYLQIDATIQYVLPEGEIVTSDHYASVQSPYNTYLNKGLPPGAICNPGLESIVAAINPESTNFYYYALGDDDKHHFFSSYSEHQAFLNS